MWVSEWSPATLQREDVSRVQAGSGKDHSDKRFSDHVQANRKSVIAETASGVS
jgi:hypothetical protein